MFNGIIENTPASNTPTVVAPSDAKECAEALQTCAERALTVIPTGGGTKLSWGNSVNAPVMLETRRMAGVREHSWQDMTATVGAGTIWSEMQNELARHEQTVALDPLWPTRATVGGVIATNDSGAMRLRYGSLRDLIIGMTVVLADGTIARSGGKVVKNVAGYDLHKLMTGAFGTLGVTAEVTFRLHPVEKQVETWTMCAQDPDSLGAAMLAILHSTISPAAMQIRTTAQGFALDVRFTGTAAGEGSLRELVAGNKITFSAEDIWNTRENLFFPDAFMLKVTALPAKIPAILTSLKLNGVEAGAVADATGICTIAVRGEMHRVLDFVNSLRSRAEAMGGAVVVLQVPGNIADIDRWGTLPPAIAVMRAVKQQFDPGRVLNPGRFLGGI